jgi:hypothetical protein
MSVYGRWAVTGPRQRHRPVRDRLLVAPVVAHGGELVVAQAR